MKYYFEGMVFEVFAYITGVMLVIIGFFIFIFPQRSRTLIIKLTTDVINVSNSVFIFFATGNPLILAGAASTGIGIVRDATFIARDKNKFFDNYLWAILFAVLNLCTLFFTYKGPISLLPAIGTTVSCLTLFVYNQKVTKLGAGFCQICYITYFAILLPSSSILTIFTLINAVTTLIGSIIGFVYLIRKEKKEQLIKG